MRDKIFLARMTTDEKRTLTTLADALGTTKSALVRGWMVKAAKRRGLPVPDDKGKIREDKEPCEATV